MKRFVVAVVLILIVAVAGLIALPSRIEPEAFSPAPPRPLEGPLARNEALEAAEVFATGENRGPEDFLVENGKVTTGFLNGQIQEWTPASTRTLCNTGGRPLGMARDAQGRLLVADADKGLLRVEADGKITTLAAGADGRPFRFTNELAVAKDGSVYFSDSSDRWQIQDFAYEVAEGRPRGRILRWEPSGRVQTLLDHLHFPNGIVLSPDESVLYFAQTTRYSVSKLVLKGPRAGKVEPFLDNLPGFPDNLSISPRGTIWLALFSLRDPLLDVIGPLTWARELVAKLPKPLWENPRGYGIVLEIDTDGNIMRSLQDPSGKHLPEVTCAIEESGWLYMGSFRAPRIARLKL